MEVNMATTMMNQARVLDTYASLSSDHKDLLIEVATNYLFEMAVAIRVPFNEIDQKDRLYKALDFLAQGWTVENATAPQWRYAE